MSDGKSQADVSPIAHGRVGREGSMPTSYDAARIGAKFVGEFVPTVPEGTEGLQSGGVDDGFELPIPGSNKEAINRFGDNPVGNLLGSNPGNGSDATEMAGLQGSKKAPVREGVYAPSRFVPKTRKGKKIVDADTSLFPFNYVAGRRSESVLSVGKDDRMSPAEAKEKLFGILAMFGVENESHEYLYTFTHALLVAHALNGASIAGPGRATFSVDADTFQFGDVVKFLGPDARRFYRAFADETAKALLSVLDRYDPSDSTTVMLCGQIRYIAVSKKLTQYPYLIHDSADACYRTSVTEMATVAKSKLFVLNNGSASNTIENLEKTVEG